MRMHTSFKALTVQSRLAASHISSDDEVSAAVVLPNYHMLNRLSGSGHVLHTYIHIVTYIHTVHTVHTVYTSEMHCNLHRVHKHAHNCVHTCRLLYITFQIPAYAYIHTYIRTYIQKIRYHGVGQVCPDDARVVGLFLQNFVSLVSHDTWNLENTHVCTG